MARRRRRQDGKKLTKHVRKSRRAQTHRDRGKHIEDDEDMFTPQRRPRRHTSGKRQDAMVIVVAVIIIGAIIGGFFSYDIFFKEESGEDTEPIIKPQNGGGSPGGQGNPIMVLEIRDFGVVEVELFFDKAPITAKNFYDLAMEKRYDGSTFHRVMEDFMIQGGDFQNGDGTGGYAAEYHDNTGNPSANPSDPTSWVIPDEFHPELRNVRGTLAMANSGPNTGGSQFFINVVVNAHLDDIHAVFGRVVGGMDIVDEISKVDTQGERPVNEVVISGIYEK